MTILFAAAAEAFDELPQSTKSCRQTLFYYRVASQEVRITAIIPGATRQA